MSVPTTLVERLKGIWYALRLTTFMIAGVLPLLALSARVRLAFAVGGLVGAAFGYKLGQAEPVPRNIVVRARQLLLRALEFLAAYLVLENALPQLGRKLPIIYESPLVFWSLVLVRVVMWALAFGFFARLFALLERAAAR